MKVYTTWTVEISNTRYVPDSIKYFRTEEEADSYIVNLKYTLHAYNITDATITKDSHTWSCQ